MCLERKLSLALRACSVSKNLLLWGVNFILTFIAANTDTKRMWNVTKNIYRFSPALVTESVGMHTVNEVRQSTLPLSNYIV